MSEIGHLLSRYDRFLFAGGNGLGANDELWSISEPIIPRVLDEFFQQLMKEPDMRVMLGDGSRLGKLRDEQLQHWKMLLGGRLDEKYQESAVRIGSVHEQIGIDLGWYIAGYAWIAKHLVTAVAGKNRLLQSRSQHNLTQLISRIFIDLMISTSAYEESGVTKTVDLTNEHNSNINLRSLADTVVSVNGTSFVLARLISNSNKARLSSQTISSAASELVASVEQIAESSEAAANEAHESNETVQEGYASINEAAGAINKMLKAVGETSEGIDELSEASSQIGQILTVIEDIADQTNLLALNATIEAARAGEAGKGFAIVASEVKNLASQTSKSTEDIARRIQALSSGMEKIRRTMTHSQSAVGEGENAITSATQTMDRIQQQVSGVYEKMLDIANILQQQKGATNEIAGSISSVAGLLGENDTMVKQMATGFQKSNESFLESAKNWFTEGSDQALCEMAKIDHVIFKKRIVDTIMERDDWKTGQVPDHHNCRLGKWYDKLERAALVGHSSYKALVEPHKKVHLHGKQALEYHARGNLDEAIAEVEKMNEASVDVVRLLDELSRSLDEETLQRNRRQFERLTTRMSAQLSSSESGVQSIVIENISKGGVGVKGAHLHPGERVQISMGNDDPRGGVAVWSEGEHSGIKFVEAEQKPAHRHLDKAG